MPITVKCSKCGYGWGVASERVPGICPYCGGVGTVSEVAPIPAAPPTANPNLIPGCKRHDTAKKFKFTYRDIARAKGVTVHAVQAATARGILDPEDLKSICRYLKIKRGRHQLKAEPKGPPTEKEPNTGKEPGDEDREVSNG